jgi:hypothetical protein
VSEAASKQKGKVPWLKLDDGDVVQLRVIDTGENFKDAYCHRTPMTREDGSEYYADVPCLDQDDKGTPCPGCADELDRRYKFWAHVIVRGDEDAEEKEAQKDRLMVWSSGITIAKRLDKLEARYGLANRDIEVEREGSTMKNTKYEIEWADDEDNPLTDEDKALAEKRFDLARYYTPPSFDDFYVSPGDRDKDDDDDPGEKSVARGSGFKRRTKEKDDEEKGTRRTSSRKPKPSSGSKKPSGLSGFGGKAGSSSSKTTKTTVRRRRSR